MKSLGQILNSRKPTLPNSNSFSGLPIRPSVKRTRFYIDNEYYERGYAAVFPHSVTTVYSILARHANHRTQICYPSAQRIMELGGIKNRRTVFDAIRILETFGIIAIIHSKGRVSNRYALLSPSAWKEVNSGKVETVRTTRKGKTTVSISSPQQSQNKPINGGADETRSPRIESEKEIRGKIEENAPLKGKLLLQRLSQATKFAVTPYFAEEDVIGALEEIYTTDAQTEPPTSRHILNVLRNRGATPIKPPPLW